MPVLASDRVIDRDSNEGKDVGSEMDAEERKIAELRRIKHEQQNTLQVPPAARASIQTTSEADAWGHHGGKEAKKG